MVRIVEREGLDGDDKVSDRRLILHSIYFDSRMTLAQGRKVPQSLACEHPILQDLMDACHALELPFEPQGKSYCRNVLTQRARLRVTLLNEDIPINPELPDRKALYVRLGSMLQTHPHRIARANAIKAQAASGQALPFPASLAALAVAVGPQGAGAPALSGGAAGGSGAKSAGAAGGGKKKGKR